MFQNYVDAIEALPASAKSTARRGALDAFLKHGLPGTDNEDWKYTDLSALSRLAALDVGPRADDFEYPASYDCGLDALNVALSGGLQQKTLQGRTEFDTGLHQRWRLYVNGEAELVLRDTAASPFALFFASIVLGPNARLRLSREQNAGTDAVRLTRLKISLARDARFEFASADLGGALVRHDLDVSLEGAGAQVQMHGLFAPAGKTHVDNHTRIDHRAAHCISREYFRGLAFDQSRAVFNGKLIVHPQAQKTDSEQRIASLLLSPKAEINAKPELQIEADDVKCAHGATFGQLDEDALFYLRSRGLTLETARTLLTRAFVEPILCQMPAGIRASVEQNLDRRFAGIHTA